MSKIEVNQISSQCGSTLTIGQSGDTVTLACGASQTGFGRTGTVNWDTTAKTAGFTAVSGNGYFVNTTSGAITVTLPASPSAGDIVALADYANTWATNNVNLSSAIYNGSTGTPALSTNGQTVFLVYVDGTKGWITTNESTTRVSGFVPITATGGTVTCCGDYKVHTFTSPGTFCVSCAGTCGSVDYLVVAGGAGGGSNLGAGGGAGGFRESGGTASGCYSVSPLGACVASLPITSTGYPITVGGGGSGGSGGSRGSSGSNSVFSTITSAGGGGGGGRPACRPGGSGGSGGGGAADQGGPGSGNTPPVSPPQGQNGGGNPGATPNNVGGGGGAGAVGGCSPGPSNSGAGGNGVASSINFSSVTRAGGGGGGGVPGQISAGPGGTGGGGAGSSSSSPGTAGTANTGGGGGGAYNETSGCGGAGGSGIVIIRYKYQ